MASGFGCARHTDVCPSFGASTPPRSSSHKHCASARCASWQLIMRPLFSASAISASATVVPASGISGSHGNSNAESHWITLGGDRGGLVHLLFAQLHSSSRHNASSTDIGFCIVGNLLDNLHAALAR